MAVAACGGTASAPNDPLAEEIARRAAFLRSPAAASPSWAKVRQDNLEALAHADQARRAGRRLLAFQYLVTVRAALASAAYLSTRPAAERRDQAAFAAEWTRLGTALHADLAPPSPAALDGVEPAVVRALGEAALSQVGAYYRASLEYGQTTTPDTGLYYLGSAHAQRAIVATCRELSRPASLRAPELRPLGPELDALESQLLAAYRPPASIDRHSEFIIASSTLKEARELDAAGLRYGALLLYLQEVERVALLRPKQGAAAPPDVATLTGSLRGLAARLDPEVDHSIGQLFLERAADALAGVPAGGSPPPAAVAVASDVLPRYLAAIGPAPPPPPRPAPRVTVTLVRWPYT